MYNRRVRHLNPASAGAVVALDARFITGVSAGAQFSPWTGRAGTSVDASNATGSAQMSYETNVQGGLPIVRGSASGRYFDLPSLTFGANWTFIMCFSQADAASSNRGVFAPSTTNSVNLELLQHDVISIPAYLRVAGSGRNTGPNRLFGNGTFGVTSVQSGAALAAYLNGASVTLSNTAAATLTAQVYAIGRYNTNLYSNPDVGSVIVVYDASIPKRKRLEQSCGFIWRVPVS